VTQRPWLTTFASISIGFSRRLVGDHDSPAFASMRMKLPTL
jgi:hypothetical protein